MKKNLLSSCFILICLTILSCGGGKTSAKSVAQKWCDLNAKVHNAPDGGPEYGKAKEAREKFEKEMETKYGDDKSLMDQIETEIEKCEGASEGR